MRTIAIKKKSYTINTSIINDKLERQVLNILLWSLGVLAFCYVLFLGNMIFNIIERKALEVSARSIVNEVGDLESQYLFVSNKVDISLAESMGFKEIKDKQYAVRKSIGSIAFVKNEL
jgi:hypothetical protein